MIRAQRAKITALEENIEKFIEIQQEQMQRINDLTSQKQILLSQNEKYQLQNKKISSELNKFKQDKTSNTNIIKGLKNQLNNWKRSSTVIETEKQKLLTESKRNDVKINRLLFENEKLKQQVTNLKSQKSSNYDNNNNEIKRLQIDNKKLKTQKSQLLLAFKKQFKLIDILKRQKMHIEAAKLL